MTAPIDPGMPCPSRREVLRGLAALPFAARGWPDLRTAPRRSPARSLILLWLDGGMSHLDTFDAKPEAPAAIRGDLGSIRGVIDGTFVSSHLPQLAARLDRCTLIRSLTHADGNHDRGSHVLLTGYRPSAVLEYPSLGAVANARLPAALGPAAALPRYVTIPEPPQYGGAGFLPGRHAPFATGGDPRRADFRVRDLTPPADAATTAELAALLDRLDGAPRSADEEARDAAVARVHQLAADPEARAPFELHRESAEIRARYGRNTLGQSLLLARRLAAAGVGVTVVRDRGWDHHQNIARAMTYGFPPKLEALDQGMAALLDDLRDQGLDERVTVCVASEFGRTPRLNPAGGRDHWPRAQSVLLAGAGIASGSVVGTTDARGEEPAEDPVSPADLYATLCEVLGVPTDEPLHTDDGRPVPVVARGGRVIAGALA